jgi:hypothetical protein
MIEPLRRIDYGEVLTLIERKRCFVLYAPRQAACGDIAEGIRGGRGE